MFLLARLGAERYAFPVEAVREVVRDGDVTPVPGAPPAIRGVHNLRGEVLPVVELGALLGVGTGSEEARCMIVADDRGLRAALAVHELLDVSEIPGELEAADAPLTGSLVVDGELVGVVDVTALFEGLGGRS